MLPRHLTMENWTGSEAYFQEAYRYYPPRAQLILDTLMADIQGLPELRYYRNWKRSFLNLLPGGGLLYLGSLSETLGYAISFTTLALGGHPRVGTVRVLHSVRHIY